jgi:hypothetical protein
MPELRTRLIAGRQLRGGSARPQAMDVRAVRHLAAHARHSADVLPEAARRPSGLASTQVQPSSRRASTIARGGI